MNIESLPPALVGYLASFICVGGLSAGFVILIKTNTNQSLEGFSRLWRISLAVFLVIAQFLICFYLLASSKKGLEESNMMMISLALGLFVNVILLRFLSQKFME